MSFLWQDTNLQVDRIKVYTDGASRGNPGPAGIGILIEDSNGKPIRKISEYIGETTNNVAEYTALLRAVNECINLNYESVLFLTDSQLVVNQIKKDYRVKNEGLKQYYVKLRMKLLNLKNWDIKHIPREENTTADSLANKALNNSVQ